jgi:hypothetical protein
LYPPRRVLCALSTSFTPKVFRGEPSHHDKVAHVEKVYTFFFFFYAGKFLWIPPSPGREGGYVRLLFTKTQRWLSERVLRSLYAFYQSPSQLELPILPCGEEERLPAVLVTI